MITGYFSIRITDCRSITRTYRCIYLLGYHRRTYFCKQFFTDRSALRKLFSSTANESQSRRCNLNCFGRVEHRTLRQRDDSQPTFRRVFMAANGSCICMSRLFFISHHIKRAFVRCAGKFRPASGEEFCVVYHIQSV